MSEREGEDVMPEQNLAEHAQTSERVRYQDLDQEQEEIEAELRFIAPEVVGGRKPAIAKRKQLLSRLEAIQEERDLRRMAAEEEARRALEAAEKQDRKRREAARKDFARVLGELVALETRITALVTELAEAFKAHRPMAADLISLAAQAATPGIQARRDLATDLERFIGAELGSYLPALRGNPSDRNALDREEWVTRTTAAIEEPLQERVPKGQAPVEAEPIPTTWINPPPVKSQEAGGLVPASLLVGQDGSVRQVSSPSTSAINEARSYYRGGSMSVVKEEDIDPLRAHGFTLRTGVTLPTGAYRIDGNLGPTGQKKGAETDAASK